MKSCDDCSYKSKDIKESKYAKHNIYCDKRKCKIPSSDEAIWCQFWKMSREFS
jgi:hypothetical protein